VSPVGVKERLVRSVLIRTGLICARGLPLRRIFNTLVAGPALVTGCCYRAGNITLKQRAACFAT
jgi:hypothetical protein